MDTTGNRSVLDVLVKTESDAVGMIVQIHRCYILALRHAASKKLTGKWIRKLESEGFQRDANSRNIG